MNATLPLATVHLQNHVNEQYDRASALGRKTGDLTSVFNPEGRAVWMYMHARPRPCFTPALLNDIVDLQAQIRATTEPVDYFILASGMPTAFNLGGDLALFHRLATNRDMAALRNYARMCCNALYFCVSGFDRGVTSIAMIQGDALGGGFEAALSCQVVVAERGTKMGFPEVMFDLFPGMGAYSFVSRRCGSRVAEKLIASGEILSAEQMHEIGLVDYLAEPGHAPDTVQALLRSRRRSTNGLRALNRARMHTPFHVPYQELMSVAEEWVQAACTLDAYALRIMERLVRAQDRLEH